MLVHTIAGIAWDPQIRGFLAVLVGVVVLIGSVYLLLLTNIGSRLGFLLAASVLFGWLTLMGLTWWVYGTIGALGEAPSWQVKEVVYDSPPSRGLPDAELEEARSLDTSALPRPEELRELDEEQLRELRAEVEPTLSGWELLPESNPSFGEAKATVEEHFKEFPDEELGLEEATSFITVYSFERGGKDDLPENPSRWDRITNELKTTFWQVQHPPRYAVIQVQPVIEQEAEPGQPPPTPEADSSKPVVSVIMVRDLGDVRFPGAMLTIFSGIMFAITLGMLHRRDLRVAEARGLLPATTER